MRVVPAGKLVIAILAALSTAVLARRPEPRGASRPPETFETASGEPRSPPRRCAQTCSLPAEEALQDTWALFQVAASADVRRQRLQRGARGAAGGAAAVAPPPAAAAGGPHPCGALAGAGPGRALSLVCGRLGPLEQLVLLVFGTSAAARAAGPSWLQLPAAPAHSAQGDGSSILMSVVVTVVVLVLLALVVFFLYRPSEPARGYEKLRDEERRAPSSAASTEESGRPSLQRMQSLLPVARHDSLPAAGPRRAPLPSTPWPKELLNSDKVLPSARGGAPPQPPLQEGGSCSSLGRDLRDSPLSGTPTPQESRSSEVPFHAPRLKSEPLPPPPHGQGEGLRPAASSPPGQGVPGGRLAAAPKTPAPGAGELPPPLCSSLVLPACEAHFAVSVPALAAVDESGGGSFEILGSTGAALLRATAQDVPAGRLLEVAMVHPGSAPRATVGPPPRAGAAPQGQAAALEVRGARGALYGTLEARSANCYAVVRGGREVLRISGASDGLDLAVTAGERRVAEASCGGAGGEGAPQLQLRVQPGIDPVLVVACVLAVVLQSTWSA